MHRPLSEGCCIPHMLPTPSHPPFPHAQGPTHGVQLHAARRFKDSALEGGGRGGRRLLARCGSLGRACLGRQDQGRRHPHPGGAGGAHSPQPLGRHGPAASSCSGARLALHCLGVVALHSALGQGWPGLPSIVVNLGGRALRLASEQGCTVTASCAGSCPMAQQLLAPACASMRTTRWCLTCSSGAGPAAGSCAGRDGACCRIGSMSGNVNSCMSRFWCDIGTEPGQLQLA